MNRMQIGRIGEISAARYLESRGWVVLARNCRSKIGEIDIVARDPSGIIVFIEVKTFSRAYENGLIPEDNLSKAKMRKFRRMCTLFSAKHSYLFGSEDSWRMDLTAITLLGSGKALLRHYINI
jgi:putative endonuclease